MLAEKVEYDKDVLALGGDCAEVLKGLLKLMKNIEIFKSAEIEKEVRRFSKENNLKTKFVFHPLRWAVSGRSRGPSLFEMCEFMGREKVVERISVFLEKIEKGGRGELL